MWQFFDTKILYTSDGNDAFDWHPFLVDTWSRKKDTCRLPLPVVEWRGYDDWVQHFEPSLELKLLQYHIALADKDPLYRMHIHGISLAESVEILRKHYRDRGYEDVFAKNYTLPHDTQITASISLRHALWCEKDKRFLNTCDVHGKPYGMISPPLRTSHDLRHIQQGLRMNCIMGIEVYPGDDIYIPELLHREILPPFSIAQMIQFRWSHFL